MSIVATGSYVGPGSTFRTVIDLLSAVDSGKGYYTIKVRRYIQVVAGVNGFGGTIVTTNWGDESGTLYKDGNYEVYDESFNVNYGSSKTITAEAYYSTSSKTYKSTANYKYTAPTPTYSVSYDANEGSGAPSKQTKTYGKDLTLSSVVPIREGYKFLNWNTKEDGSGTSYNPNSTYTTNAGVTLYAQWERVVLTVTFDAETNGGSVEEKTRLVNYGGTIGTLPTATKKNYAFLGWSRNPNTEDYISENDIVIESKTVYAMFKMVANCYVKHNGKYVPSMMYKKQTNGEYKTGIVSVRKNGTYKESSM